MVRLVKEKHRRKKWHLDKQLYLVRKSKCILTWLETSIVLSLKTSHTSNSKLKVQFPEITITLNKIITKRRRNYKLSTNSQTQPNQHTTIPKIHPLRQVLNLQISCLLPVIIPNSSANSIATFIKTKKSFIIVFNANYWYAPSVLCMDNIRIITFILSKRLLLNSRKHYMSWLLNLILIY